MRGKQAEPSHFMSEGLLGKNELVGEIGLLNEAYLLQGLRKCARSKLKDVRGAEGDIVSKHWQRWEAAPFGSSENADPPFGSVAFWILRNGSQTLRSEIWREKYAAFIYAKCSCRMMRSTTGVTLLLPLGTTLSSYIVYDEENAKVPEILGLLFYLLEMQERKGCH